MNTNINNFINARMKSSKIAVLLAALIFFATIPTLVQAAAPAEQWNKTFGGTLDDSANSVQNTYDGGYIIAGTTSSDGAGGSDAWLIKVDSSGNQTWNKTFGGTLDDGAKSVQQTSDGGYIIAGTTSSYGAGGSDAWLIKVDSSGNQSWNKTFGGTLDDSANSVQQTADGGYIIAATNSSYDSIMGAAWLIKVDSSGNQQWNNAFFKTDDSNTDYQASSASQTSEGGYIIAGWVEMPTANDNFWLSKVDSSGNQIWSKTYNGFAGGYDQAYSVQQTSDGGYILAGVAVGDMGDPNAAWLVKTDSNGNMTWDKRFGGGYETDVAGCAYSVYQTSDGGYIIAGTIRPYESLYNDVWLIKVDSNGNQQWNTTFGETLDDSANSVQQTSDGGYIIAGETMSYGAGSEDAWLIKVAPDISTISSMTPTHDNRLRQSSPNTVLSNTPYLDIGKSAYRCRDVMLFDLSMYNNTIISKATLSLYWYYPAGATRTSDTVVEIYRPLQWDSLYVTWNSRISGTPWDTAGGNWFDKNGVDQGTTPYASVTFPASVFPDNRYYEFDVTELVQEYVSGTTNTGFFLKAKTESSNYIAFYSSDWSNADQRPKLTITTTSVPVDNPPVANSGPDQVAATNAAVTFNGSASIDDNSIESYSWDFDVSDGITTDATGITATKTYATAGNYTVTLTVTDNGGQTDSDTMQVVVGNQVTTIAYTPEYDNRLRQSSPNTVLSNTPYLDIGKSAYRCRDVMLFNLSMYNNTTISKATLSLYWYYPAGATRTSDTVVDVYRPLQWDPQYVTWNSRMSGTPWDTAGGNWFDKNGVDQGTTPYASVTFPASVVPDNRYYEFDVTELVQEYVSGTNNTGFFLKARTEGGNYIAFYSSEWPNADQRPKLTITHVN